MPTAYVSLNVVAGTQDGPSKLVTTSLVSGDVPTAGVIRCVVRDDLTGQALIDFSQETDAGGTYTWDVVQLLIERGFVLAFTFQAQFQGYSPDINKHSDWATVNYDWLNYPDRTQVTLKLNKAGEPPKGKGIPWTTLLVVGFGFLALMGIREARKIFKD